MYSYHGTSFVIHVDLIVHRENNRQHRLPATGLGLPLVFLTVAAFTLQGSYSQSPAQSFLRARRPPGGMEHSYYTDAILYTIASCHA